MSAGIPDEAIGLRERIETLNASLRKLAEDESSLRSIVHLMEYITPVCGIENMVRALLAGILETIGGTGIKLYYWIEGELHYADSAGSSEVRSEIDDPVAAQAAQSRKFVEQADVIGRDWVFPLLVGTELVGVIKVEHLPVGAASLRDALSAFFGHVALILSNEIRNSARQREDRALAKTDASIRRLMMRLPVALSLVNADGTISGVNDRFVEIFGYTPDDVPTIEAWWPRAYPDPAYRQHVMSTWQAVMDESMRSGSDIPAREYWITCKNGEARLVEVSGVVLADGLVATFVDVTERKRTEELQRRLNRELRAITSCNHALLRTGDEQALLDEICRIICQQAGYRMAWVGYIQRDEASSVLPRAWAGVEDGYLAQVGLTWADTPEGHRPLGTAIRTGRTSYVQDFSSEPERAAWIDHGLARGYRSAIALPLKKDLSVTFGVLCIYSDHTHAFTSDELTLLEELAADLAYGIMSLRLRAERSEAEKQLAASEQLFRTLVENSPDFIIRYDLQLRRVYVNPPLKRLLDATVGRTLGTSPTSGSPLVDPDRYIACLRWVIDNAEEHSEEVPYRDASGESRWANMRFAPEFDADGKVSTVLVLSRDITEHKRAEEERQAHLHFLESLDRVNRVLQGSGSLGEIMDEALDAVLDIFGCDRAYLLYPCDPTKATWSVPIERTRPEYPGVLALAQELPMDGWVTATMRALLDASGPVQKGPGTEFPIDERMAKEFSIRSFMAMALRPKEDLPWQFGIHQCSRERTWTAAESRLFEEIGRRLSDGLDSLLTTRNLRESEQRFRLVFESSPLPIWEEDYSALKTWLDELRLTGDGDIERHLLAHPEAVRDCAALVRVVDVNRAAVALHNADSKEDLLARLPRTLIAESYNALRRQVAALARGETELRFDSAIQTLTGKRREVSVYFSVCPGYERTLAKILISTIDITERKHSEDRLRLAASVFATSQEGILISDADNRIIDVNPAFTRLTGYGRDEACGRNPSFLSAHRQSKDFYQDMWRAIETRGEWQGELWNRRKSGEVYAELLSIIAVRDERGRLQHYVGAFSDISVIKEHEADLDRIAHYDVLTAVPNRRLLGDRLEQALARARRLGKNLAVCYLDLDGFKPVNDQFGHEGGDRLLVEIARRLQSMSRADDTVARLGGDEFVLLWNDIEAEADCFQALERILAAVSAPVNLDGIPVSVSASIGVTLYPDDDVDADSLLRHADHAMYSAKQLGKNRYQMFDARLERQMSSRAEFLAKVAHGLESGQFELHYQPKVDCAAGTVCGVEALIRWNDPILGAVGPKEFLPLIENDNLAFRMGRWVMEQAVCQARLWQDMGITLPISINMFPRHLRYPTFTEDLRRVVALHWPQLPKGRLLLEIIETSDLEELDPIEQVIKECLKMGIGFSLDDFGTGYSSLVYLRRLSVEELKIDQSFVRDMLEDADDEAIVVGVIGLGRAFGLRVVAEGVESERQARHLVDLGCTVVQGYGLGRPMPADAFQEWYADFVVNGLSKCR